MRSPASGMLLALGTVALLCGICPYVPTPIHGATMNEHVLFGALIIGGIALIALGFWMIEPESEH